MEKPIPDGYDLNAHSNWWKTVNGVYVENLSIEKLIDMLNHNISFREFTLLMFLIKQQYSSYLDGDKVGMSAVGEGLKDKLDILHYGTLPFANYVVDGELTRTPISANRLSDFLNDERRSVSGFVNKGLTDAIGNYGNTNRTYFLWYLSMFVKSEMFEGNKNANHNDLLKGKILYKPLASWKSDSPNIDNRTLYEIMYLEPVRPSFANGTRFQYHYKHRKDYYFRCKNGRPYKLTKLNITVNEFSDKQAFNAGMDINRKTIKWGFGIQNTKPVYDRAVYSKLSGLEAEAYKNHTFKGMATTFFIPDNDVGMLWSKSKADILTEGLISTMNQELQHIDVLKNTSTVNYLSKQADLKYFGDVQDVPITNLNDIDITGYKIKSKPIHFINWLKSNNPLGGGK